MLLYFKSSLVKLNLCRTFPVRSHLKTCINPPLLIVCFKSVNPRNIPCRHAQGKSAHILQQCPYIAFLVLSVQCVCDFTSHPTTSQSITLTTCHFLQPRCLLELHLVGNSIKPARPYTGRSFGDTQLLKVTKEQENPRLEAETRQSKVFNVEGDKALEQFNKVNLPSLDNFKPRGDVFYIQCCTSSRSQLRAVL